MLSILNIYCNVMITGPADHGFDVIPLYELKHHPACIWFNNFIFSSQNLICLNLIFFATARSSLLYCLFTATISSLLYWLGYQLTSTLSRVKVLCIACDLNKQLTWLLFYKKRLLANQRLSKFAGDRAREVSLCSIKKSYWKRHK